MRGGIMLAVAVLAAGAFAAAAAAKEGGVELGSTPAGIEPGERWVTTLTLVGGSREMAAHAEPGVAIRSAADGRRLDFPATATDIPGTYVARVVFPDAGWWTVQAYDGVSGRNYTVGVGQFLIDAPGSGGPAAAPSARDAAEGGPFPVWPAAAGGSLLLLAAFGGALFLRRRLPRLSH